MAPQRPDTRSGALIRERRHRQALTGQELARRVGRATRSVIRWERGHALPPPELIRNGNGQPGKLAKALDTPWQELAEARAYDERVRRELRALGETDPAVLDIEGKFGR
jgi:transcriptional regulator with XRE-family HTH domain